MPPFAAQPCLMTDDGLRSEVSKEGIARILIVEDDFLISSEMEIELAAAGFEIVAVARSANEAVALALRHKPDLVVMDIRIQGSRDGVEAAIEIFNSSGIRSLFASAHHNRETQQRAETCFPLGWLAKPFTMSALVDAVSAAVRDIHYRRGGV